MASKAQKDGTTNDRYIAIIEEHWDKILMVYGWHHDKHPIIEYDIDDQKIYSYPAFEYIETLNPHERLDTRKVYQQSVANHELFIFVKETSKRCLRSFLFPLPNEL